MGIIDWLIVLLPVVTVLFMAIRSRRYVTGVPDFLSAGRVCGRYVIGTTELTNGLAVLTLIANTEVNYKTGFAMNFWNSVLVPITLFMSLRGFCIYRFRETRAMSLGQFIEMRYNRSLRIFASAIRTSAEMIANMILPAVSARFFIYFLGLPHKILLPGNFEIPTYTLVMLIVLTTAVSIICFGGQLALTVTNTVQCLICYPMIVLFIIYILCRFSWSDQIVPVMLDRVKGESFLNPFDISGLRDFNLFALGVLILNTILNRANWIGTGTSTAARSPHEQKMAGVLEAWRLTFVLVFYLLFATTVIVTLNHRDYAADAKNIKSAISARIAGEISDSESQKLSIIKATAEIPEIRHNIGTDEPLSQAKNLDTPYLEAVHNVLGHNGSGNAKFQEFRTLYHQLMLPMTFRHLLPEGMLGLFCLLMVMLMISTDDSRIFSSAVTLTQDIILPFRPQGFTPAQHIRMLRWVSAGVGVFFFCGASFMSQLDYINLFVQIVVSIWSAGAGSMLVFGLYTRRGTTAGAFAALFTGSFISISGIAAQRNWAEYIYPWLESRHWSEPLGRFLETVSSPFNPLVVWKMDAVKFPINSVEMFFLGIIISMAVYWIVSFLTFKKPFDLDRMLHRGDCSTGNTDKEPPEKFSVRKIFSHIIGINSEYTTGDKIIAWAVFAYSIVFSFGCTFLGVLIWNMISPWNAEAWGKYFLWVWLIVPGTFAAVTTVWFSIGGITDLRQMFRDLAARHHTDSLDDGRVDNNRSATGQPETDK